MKTLTRNYTIHFITLIVAFLGMLAPMEKICAQDIIWQGSLNGDIYAPGNPTGAGIGTTNPTAKLHVANGAFLVEGSQGTIEGFDHLGPGTRLMWVPELNAFRVGTISEDGYYSDIDGDSYYWDKENIGYGSVAIGQDSVADQLNTIALGAYAESTGGYSVCLGTAARATDTGGVSIGWASEVRGQFGVAIGNAAVVNKSAGIAIGKKITNNFANSILIGVENKPSFYGDYQGVILNGAPVGTQIRYPLEVNGNTRLNGNLYIGVTQAQAGTHKLAVKGSIKAEEIIVESTWADYVLDESYPLPSLKDVSAFIKENKRLPEVPSEKQIEKDGLRVADMMTIQMKKIEELTLYAIALKEENETLKTTLHETETHFNRRLDELETRLVKALSE